MRRCNAHKLICHPMPQRPDFFFDLAVFEQMDGQFHDTTGAYFQFHGVAQKKVSEGLHGRWKR